MSRNIYNINIESITPLASPEELKSGLPVEEALAEQIAAQRDDIARIIAGEDSRFLLITGPCSIHDVDAALEYAGRLAELRQRFSDSLYIVMRVYFEKPRTSLGWRGMIVDPFLDGSYEIKEGLLRARRLMLDIARMGIPIGSEVLDPIIPQYIADLVSWAAIGARTIESQTHREIASGLSMPVGFKNGTDGNLMSAVNAIRSSREGHSFIGIDQDGQTCILKTRGNSSGHVILRGGSGGPNYYEENVEEVEELLSNLGIPPAVMIDCSHANSGKKYSRQSRVFRSALELALRGRSSVRGVMLESNLVAGRQDVVMPALGKLGKLGREVPGSASGIAGSLKYGQSITDECIGWEETENLITEAAEKLAAK